MDRDLCVVAKHSLCEGGGCRRMSGHRATATGVTVLVPGVLQHLTNQQSHVVIAARCETVREVLLALATQFPGVVERVLTETGVVREHVHVYVGEENIKFGLGLDESVRSGDEVQILHAVSGG